MKKVFQIIFLMAVLVLCSWSVYGADSITVRINGKEKTYQTAPTIVDGRVMIPFKEISEDLHCKVKWDEATKTAQLTNKIIRVAVQANNLLLSKNVLEDSENTRHIKLDVPPKIINGTFMVPARAFSEALNAKVDWDSERQTLDIVMEYEFIADYREDLAVVMKDNQYGAINRSREIVIPLEYEEIDARYGFCNGIVRAVKNGKEGYISRSNQIVIPFEYDFIGGFYDEENKNHFYQPDEKYDGSSYYEITGNFTFTEEGVSVVEKDGRQGVIDTQNRIILPIEYHEVDSYFDGRAVVLNDKPSNYKVRGQCALVDTTGREIIPYGKYDSISLLENMRCGTYDIGYAIYAVYKGYGWIDTNETVIIEPIYDSIYIQGEFKEGKKVPRFFLLRKGDKYGAMLLDGSKKTELIYDFISYSDIDGLYYYTQNGKDGTLDKNLNPILQTQ